MASIVRCNLFQRDPRSGRTVNSYQFPTNPFEPLQVFSPPFLPYPDHGCCPLAYVDFGHLFPQSPMKLNELPPLENGTCRALRP